MAALWKKCKRCRRLYRSRSDSRCSFCPSGTKLHGIRRELADPFEAAYLVGGMWAAQELATPGRVYDQLLDGDRALWPDGDPYGIDDKLRRGMLAMYNSHTHAPGGSRGR